MAAARLTLGSVAAFNVTIVSLRIGLSRLVRFFDGQETSIARYLTTGRSAEAESSAGAGGLASDHTSPQKPHWKYSLVSVRVTQCARNSGPHLMHGGFEGRSAERRSLRLVAPRFLRRMSNGMIEPGMSNSPFLAHSLDDQRDLSV